MKLDEEFITTELADYKAGFPYWGLIDGSDIDSQVCAESKCEKCGHQGMNCRPFIKDNPIKSYRAFAECPECGEAFEF